MLNFSQNKKIAISALSLFAVSLTTMIFFLGGDVKGGADVIGAESGHKSTESQPKTEENKLPIDSKFFTTDVSGKIMGVGQDFCKILKKDCAAIIGKSIYKLVNKADVSDLAAILGKLAQKEQSIDSIGPIRFNSLEGKEKLLLLNAKSIKDKDENVSDIKFSIIDISKKVDNLNNPNAQEDDPQVDKPLDEKATENLMKNIYPKIKDMGEQGNKLLVNKVSFKSEE